MALLSSVIQRGTRASQPAATTVSIGTLYYVTDEHVIERSTGSAWQSYIDAMTGDSGSGGVKGLVPAPGSGDAAAGKFLKADGTWATAGGGGGSWTLVSKSSTEDKTSTTVAADADLKITMLASTTYWFRLVGFFRNPDNFTSVLYRITGPASPTLVTWGHYWTRAGGTTFDVNNREQYSTGDETLSNSGIDEAGLLKIEGFVQNGSNAGDMNFKWGSGTGGEKIRLYKGSYIEYRAL